MLGKAITLNKVKTNMNKEREDGPIVEPLHKHIIGNHIRMLIREVCLCKGN